MKRMTNFVISILKLIILFPITFIWFVIKSFVPNPQNRYEREEERDFLPDYFKMRFGMDAPLCFDGRFDEAAREARDQCRFLLVYIHSAVHEETELFLTEVLCTESVSSFINDNFIFYGVDVNSSQGQALNSRLSATNYPYLAVLCNVSGSNDFMIRIQSLGFDTTRLRGGLNFLRSFNGFTDKNTLMYELSTVIELYHPILQIMRDEQRDISVTQDIIREQDEAYLESLRQDQEKQRIRAEEERLLRIAEEERIREENELMQSLNKRENNRERILRNLPVEPEKSEETTTIAIRLSNGTRITRRFYQNDVLQILFDFIELNEDSLNYRILTQFPKKHITASASTFIDEELVPNASIFVEEIF